MVIERLKIYINFNPLHHRQCKSITTQQFNWVATCIAEWVANGMEWQRTGTESFKTEWHWMRRTAANTPITIENIATIVVTFRNDIGTRTEGSNPNAVSVICSLTLFRSKANIAFCIVWVCVVYVCVCVLSRYLPSCWRSIRLLCHDCYCSCHYWRYWWRRRGRCH